MKKDKNYYLLEIVKPYKYIYLLIVFFTFLNGFLASFNIVAIFPLLQSILPGSLSDKQFSLFQVQNLVNVIPIKDPVLACSIFLFVVTILAFVSSLFLEYLIGRGSSSIGYTLKDSLFKKYAALDYQFFIEHKHGELFYYLFSAPQSTMSLFTLFPQFASEVIHILFLLGLLFTINVKFTTFLLCLVLLFIAIINGIARHVSYSIGKIRKQFGIEQQVITNEFINGIKHIALYLAKPRWIAQFDKANIGLRRAYLKEVVWISIPKNVLELLMYLSIVVVAFLARYKVVSITYLAGAAVYIAASVRLFPHIANVGRIRMTIMRLLPDAEATHEITSYQEGKSDKETTPFFSLKNSIVFKDVHFSYKDRPSLLKGVSFTIDAMKTTAVVGVSGSGKTTIINLLLKLLKPTKGEILVDGVSLEEYTTESWLRNITLVSQDPFIFNSTIKDNITFYNERYSMEDIIKAARISYADEFIEKFPDKYETVVGEKGMKLSTGQQQRIAIARAIVREPKILIFDEATNALDSISEEMIQKAMNGISSTRTVIVIAHRLSTLKDADKIIVIKDGVKVEEGLHDRLIQVKGHYQNMYYANL